MNKKAIIVSICLMASMIGCSQLRQSQPKGAIGQNPLSVEYLDFNMNVREFYPFRANRVTRAQGALWITIPVAENVLLAKPRQEQTLLLSKQIIDEEQIQMRLFNAPPRISFSQSNTSSILQLATFDDFIFDKIYMETTLDYEIMLVTVVDTFGTEEIADNLQRFLNEKYGNVRKREVSSFGRYSYILYWELSDRIIKFRAANRTAGTLTVRMGEYGVESIGNEVENERLEIRLDIVNKEFAHKFEDRRFVWWQ